MAEHSFMLIIGCCINNLLRLCTVLFCCYVAISSSPMSGRVDSVRLTLDFAPSDVAVPRTATSVLLLPAHVWNSLPTELRQSDSQTAIKDLFVWVMGPQRFVTLTSCKLAL